MTRKQTNNWIQEKPNDFGLKYDNQKTYRKSRMDKQYDKRIRRTRRRPESGNTHRFTQNDIKNEYETGKRLAMMEYMVSGSRNSHPFTTDEH